MKPFRNIIKKRPRQPIGPWARRTGGLLLLLCLALIWQGFSGAWFSEFGGHPDEAGHYVTGLMVHDYIAAGLPGHPLRYARDYYDHYPKVALGHWPPGFYLLQTLWTLPFSPWRLSVLILMAMLAAALGALLMLALEAETGSRRWAFTGAVLLLCLPLVQEYTGMVMTEIPVTLFMLAAVLCFGRFLDHENWADGFGFSLFASLAILTKGTGLLLALVPPIGVVLSRRYHLLRRLRFWLPAMVVMVLCGPWTLLTLSTVRNGWLEGVPSWSFIREAIPYYLTQLYNSAGPGVLLFAMYGFIIRRVYSKPKPESSGFGRSTALAALVPAVLAFHFLIPCGLEARHLIPVLPPLVYFAFCGLQEMGNDLIRRGIPARNAQAISVAFTLIILGANITSIPQKHYAGFADAATQFIPGLPGDEILLVSSDARGEGMFIAEMAMREKRPGHRILRASKALGNSTWSGKGYQSRFQNVLELRRFLTSNSIRYIILDRTIPSVYRVPHHRLLEKTVASYPEEFKPVATIPIIRKGRYHDRGLLICRIQ